MTNPLGNTPTDVAGLVERLTELADFSEAAKGDHRRGVHPDSAARAFREAAQALTTLAAEKAQIVEFIRSEARRSSALVNAHHRAVAEAIERGDHKQNGGV